MSSSKVPSVTQKQALTNLLESIALEETALAHFIHAEAERVTEYMQSGSTGLDTKEVIRLQKSVTSFMQTAIKMQMMLQFKLEQVIDAQLQLTPNNECNNDTLLHNTGNLDVDANLEAHRAERKAKNPLEVEKQAENSQDIQNDYLE
ncbi:MAG TPA: hypothetical protein VGL27_00675 [Negativicutes bacterium]|jgi:plasmid maintenance system antidote protein VapI